MFAKGIIILEHDDFLTLFVTTKFTFKCFGLKKDDEEFVSNEEVSRELGPNYTSPCFQLTFEADIRNAKEQIVERLTNNVLDRTTVKTEPSITTELSSRMQGIFCCLRTYLYDF